MSFMASPFLRRLRGVGIQPGSIETLVTLRVHLWGVVALPLCGCGMMAGMDEGSDAKLWQCAIYVPEGREAACAELLEANGFAVYPMWPVGRGSASG
jgi:hypothetical protein